MAFFSNASGTVINGGIFLNKDNESKELTPLYDKVAPNAILNSGGRADPVRCHPGTREEVIAKMEKRIADGNAGDSGVFWLSGPAGAGKSAIMQTVAEGCIKRKVPMASFFFFRADGTRNHSDPFVATLLYQLFDLYPALMAHVAAIAARNPVIFRKSIQEQFSALIEAPLLAVSPSSEHKPLVILIDGLDECSTGNGKEDQVSLLNILHDISTRPTSPTAPAYVVLVASRTESHLTMAFRRIGCHSDSIYLDDSYRPSDDIRAFLRDKFLEIRRMHPLSDTLPPDWPSSTDLDALIEKSSGQFVYPSTVTRFIADSAASPKRSLEIVLGLRPPTRTSPFATLDALYTYILSQAEDWSSVRDILASQTIFTSTELYSQRQFMDIITYLGYTEDDILSSLSDLTAIIRFRIGDKHLTIYHASLNDFLLDKDRAGNFYIDISTVACRVAPSFLRQSVDRPTLHGSLNILKIVIEPDEELTDFLRLFLPDPKPFQEDWEKGFDTADLEDNIIKPLERLYELRNPPLLETLRKRWREWFSIANRSRAGVENGHITDTSSLQSVPSQPSLHPSTLPLQYELSEPSTDDGVPGRSNPAQIVSSQPYLPLPIPPSPHDLSEPSTSGGVTGKSVPDQTVPSEPFPRQSTAPLPHDLVESSGVPRKSIPDQPSPGLSTQSLPDDLLKISSDSDVSGNSNPAQVPAAAPQPQAPHRPSTPLSRLFSKLVPRRNRHAKSKK